MIHIQMFFSFSAYLTENQVVSHSEQGY